MRVQLWSYFYDPEPQGIAPLSHVLAVELAAAGHEVLVVAAHPHYPEPIWGSRLRPYRDRRDGIPVLRLPLWIGRDTTLARVREEASFGLTQALVAPILPSCDCVIAVTPCFPALAAAMAYGAVRRTPWILWLQDLVTDAAATTGLLADPRVLAVVNRFERATYRAADRIVVISETFRQNLLAKGVPTEKIERIFNPSTRGLADLGQIVEPADGPRVLVMGNIGHSQGLDAIVDAFQDDPELKRLGASLRIAGHGVSADAVRGRIHDRRVQMLGVLHGEELVPELRSASLGLVSQRADIAEFNFPSKLMNYLANGVPVLASVRLDSETARVVRESGAGWVTDAAEPAAFARKAAEMVKQPEALMAARRAGLAYARDNFAPRAVAHRFEAVMEKVTS
jgi:colanic acid biosynthesis glycosyl transferase WcaI